MYTQANPVQASETKYLQAITKEEIHEKLKKRFYLLNEEKARHYYFCSYDFRENEKEMVPFWSEIIGYYYDSIYSTFALKVSRILDISRIDGRNPVGLHNIMIKLCENGDYFTQKDLNSNSFYNAIDPSLYPTGMLSYLASSVFSTLSSYLYEPAKRDLSKDDIYFNRVLFEEHCAMLLKELEDALNERDTSVMTTKEFSLLLLSRQVPNGDSYLNFSLLYLSKLKKIALFKLSDQSDTECIKLLKDVNDAVSDKDQAIVNILLCINSVNKKIKECERMIQYNHQRAKECLAAKMKENARMCLKKKHFYFQNEQHYNNILFTLEQNLVDLKSMESTMKVKEIMDKVNKAAKDIKLKPEDVETAMDEMKDMNYAMNDLKSDWKDYVDVDENDEEINAEIDTLLQKIKKEDEGIAKVDPNASVKTLEFPNAHHVEKEKAANESNDDIEKILAQI